MALGQPRNTTSWGIGIANSFRNTSKKLFGNWPQEAGGNLQNPSDRICQLYIPDDGKVFIQCDQAGADARVMAYLMPAGNKLRLLYEHDIKPHTYIALHLFKEYWIGLFDSATINVLCTMAISDLQKHSEWPRVAEAIKTDKDSRTGFELKYFLGKKSVHSFNYKKMPQTFIFDILKESEGKLVIPLDEGIRIYDTYHSLVPELRRLHVAQEKHLRTYRELRNLQGFPRRFEGLFCDKFFREAISFIPQSTVACINKDAWIDMQEYIETHNKDWDILNEKHDSLLMQVPIPEALEAGKILKNFQERKLLSPYGETFYMKSELSIGANWRKESKTNPTGMKEVKV